MVMMFLHRNRILTKTDLKRRPVTLVFREECKEYTQTHCHRKELSKLNPEAQVLRPITDQSELLKLKGFCKAKITIIPMKSANELENIYVSYIKQLKKTKHQGNKQPH